MTEEVEKTPSIGISLNVDLPMPGSKRQLVLQSFIERDGDMARLNDMLDKLRIASDRQFAFCMLEGLKLQLEQEEKIARDHAARMAQVDENIHNNWSASGRKGDPRLSQKQEHDQRQAYQNAEESKRRINKVKANIAEYEGKIGANHGGI